MRVFPFAVFILCLLSVMVNAQSEKGSPVAGNNNEMRLIAHRGESATAPENTLAAFRLAWQNDADGIECDIHLSKDNRIMVIHDGNTRRTTGTDLQVKDTEAAVLRRLDAGALKDSIYAGERIPFLEEVTELLPEGKLMVIEIKCGAEVIPYLKKVIDESGREKQIAIISFDWQVITEAKNSMPDIPCYWLSSKKETLETKMAEAAEAGLDGLDLNYSVIDETVMDQARRLGLDIIAWTVDDTVEAERLLSLGVDTITTNKTLWLRSEISCTNTSSKEINHNK